jgi:photosystem II stability/assembly factor-like uncharacterized protein
MRQLLQSLFFFLLVTQICFGQWYEQNSGTTKNLNDVVFIDANVGIAVGDSGLILRTTDGGTLWSIVPTIVSNSLTSVCFVDSTNGWIGGNRLDIYPGDSSVIIRTTDSGMNWYKQADLDLYRVNDVFFVDQNNGFIVGREGGGGNLFQTTDGGETWSDTTLPNYGMIWERIYFVDHNIGWILGRICGVLFCTSSIYKTIDGGNTWQLQMEQGPLGLYDISFTDTQNGIAVGQSFGPGVLYQTSDGGETWLENPGPPFEETIFVDVFQISNSVFAIWGMNYDLGDVFYWSTDSGVTWQLRGSYQNVPLHQNRIFFTDTSNGWAVGDGGIILHTTNGGVSFVEEEQIGEIPTEFLLSQNYPNPFNPSTKIKYSVPQTSQVQIKVFDVLGNEIETLVNEEKSVGTYELTWNAASFPSGVYFYQLKAGDYISTKKMILLK